MPEIVPKLSVKKKKKERRRKQKKGGRVKAIGDQS